MSLWTCCLRHIDGFDTFSRNFFNMSSARESLCCDMHAVSHIPRLQTMPMPPISWSHCGKVCLIVPNPVRLVPERLRLITFRRLQQIAPDIRARDEWNSTSPRNQLLITQMLG